MSSEIFVFKWDNLAGKYLPLMLMSQEEGEERIIDYTNLAAVTNMTGLNEKDTTINSNIPAALADMLPGAFANKILAATDPQWKKDSDFTKMARLGSRDVGAYRFVVNNQARDESMLIGQDKLDAAMGTLHVALSKGELNKLLDKSNFLSLTSTKGSQPKIEYQDEDGERWVVKTFPSENQMVSNAFAKMELATLMMMDDLDIDAPEGATHTCPDGQVVFMSKHYNLSQPVIDKNTGYADYRNRYNTLSVKTLNDVSNARADGVHSSVFDYKDVVKTVELYSDFTKEQRINLMTRAAFELAINSTATVARNIELIEDDWGNYRLAPAVGVIPDSAPNAFGLTIDGKYSRQSQVKFDDALVESFSKTFDLPSADVKASLGRVANTVMRREDYMTFVGMDEKEKHIFNSAFLSNELMSGMAKQVKIDPMQSLKNTFISSMGSKMANDFEMK